MNRQKRQAMVNAIRSTVREHSAGIDPEQNYSLQEWDEKRRVLFGELKLIGRLYGASYERVARIAEGLEA